MNRSISTRFSRHVLEVLAASLVLCGLSSIAQETAEPAGFDVIVKNGKILDGTGGPWYSADIGVRGDRIVAIGKLEGAGAAAHRSRLKQTSFGSVISSTAKGTPSRPMPDPFTPPKGIESSRKSVLLFTITAPHAK